MATITVEQLKKIDSIKDVPDNQLQWFIDQSKCLELEEGDLLFKMGDPIKNTNVIIEERSGSARCKMEKQGW